MFGSGISYRTPGVDDRQVDRELQNRKGVWTQYSPVKRRTS